MLDQVEASAPGKLILMGEHAVVYGQPALVAAVDLRLTVRLRRTSGAPGLRLRLSDLEPSDAPAGIDGPVSWSMVDTETRQAAAQWQRWFDANGTLPFEPAGGVRAVRLAVGEARAAAVRLGGRPREDTGIELEIRSQLPVGAGFGSSAAMAVAVVLAWWRLCGLEVDDRGQPGIYSEVQRTALEIERRQHGTPSGVDTAAVLHGGLLWARRRTDGSVEMETVVPAHDGLRDLRVYHSGVPVETTGQVVAAVRERRQRQPAEVDAALDALGAATRALRAYLTQRDAPRAALQAAVRRAEAALETLGVVPEPVRRRLRQLEAAGGAGKISGAGALSGAAAGCVLALAPAEEASAGPGAPITGAPGTGEPLPGLDGLRRLDVSLGDLCLRNAGALSAPPGLG